MSQLRVIFRTAELHQAHMLQSLLDEHGVRAQVVEWNAMEGKVFGGQAAIGGGDVVVFSEDETISQGIAELFRKNILEARTDVDAGREPSQVAPLSNGPNGQDWAEWPQCPECGERRQTVCPICKTAGHQFQLGELPGELDAHEVVESLTSTSFLERDFLHTELSPAPNVLLVCQGCDEPFLPRFYNQCEHCGHAFGNGIDGGSNETDFENPNWALTIGIALIAAFLIGLFLLAS